MDGGQKRKLNRTALPTQSDRRVKGEGLFPVVNFVKLFILEAQVLIAVKKNVLRQQIENSDISSENCFPDVLAQAQREHLPVTSFLSLTL